MNTKVAAARDHQAQVAGARQAKARLVEEAAEAKEWSKGSNQRGSKREDEAARKQDEKAAKAAAKKALEAAEAKELTGLKSVVVSACCSLAAVATRTTAADDEHDGYLVSRVQAGYTYIVQAFEKMFLPGTY